MSAEPQWSLDPPTEPGHYWAKFGMTDNREVHPVTVKSYRGCLQVWSGLGWRPLQDRMYWHGVEWWPEPITPPSSS